MDMEYQSVRLTDLPDEILLYIFRKLNNIQLLYSMMDLDSRLDNILNESIFMNRLTLVQFISSLLVERGSSSLYYTYPLLDPLLDRFCVHILPKIHEKVRWLDLESSSMERILLAANYPNLVAISLLNIQAEKALQVFADERLFTSTYKNQILSLFVDTARSGNPSSMILINANGEQLSTSEVNTILFTHIFDTFPNLQSLNYCSSSIDTQRLSFNKSPPAAHSSTILELYVRLDTFQDCLYLLDGRFNQLRLLHVYICYISPSGLIIDNKEKLPNLNSFTLFCDIHTQSYDQLVLPLLHRMLNLEKLDLSLPISNDKPFVDGHNLTVNIINHMPLLNKFTFNIRSSSRFYNENNIPSHEYIQETFKDFPNKLIISCVDYFQESQWSQCHFYSYPYPCQLRSYEKITNNFPGGIFKCVREVSLNDERPFKHDFFLRISQSFPFLESLTIVNMKPQKNQPFRKSPNQNEDLPIIEYPYLTVLDLIEAHEDYYEQFLFDDRSCLPNNIWVPMDYTTAEKVTDNFRSNAARNNCAKILFTAFWCPWKFPDHIKDYFPRAEDL